MSSAATSTSTTRRGRSTSSGRWARRCRASAMCPIILGDDGLKLSKRRGAVSVTAYREAGYLPEAMLNYLARLGWSHGDEELFTKEQMVSSGSTAAIWPRAPRSGIRPSSPGSTAHHLKLAADDRLAGLLQAQLASRGVNTDDLGLLVPLRRAVQGPLQHRGRTGRLDRDAVRARSSHREEDLAQHVGEAVQARAAARAARHASTTIDWDKATIAAAMKETSRGPPAQDAAARARLAGAGVRSCADPVDRCGACAVPEARNRAGALGAASEKLSIIAVSLEQRRSSDPGPIFARPSSWMSARSAGV